MRRGAVLAGLWALCLLTVLTSAPNRAFTLLEPGTAGWGTVLGAFLLTSGGLLLDRPLWLTASLPAAHLAVIAFLFLMHPLSAVLGRDGALLAIGLYGLAFLAWKTRLRREWLLLSASGRVHLFDSMNGLGVFYSRRPLPLLEQCYHDLQAVLEDLARAAGKARLPLLLAAFPQRFQVSPAEWRATVREYGLEASAFELEQPDRRLAVACARAGIECLDLLPAFRAEPRPTYLRLGDMHWNARGHAVAARALAPVVASRLPSQARSGTASAGRAP